MHPATCRSLSRNSYGRRDECNFKRMHENERTGKKEKINSTKTIEIPSIVFSRYTLEFAINDLNVSLYYGQGELFSGVEL